MSALRWALASVAILLVWSAVSWLNSGHVAPWLVLGLLVNGAYLLSAMTDIGANAGAYLGAVLMVGLGLFATVLGLSDIVAELRSGAPYWPLVVAAAMAVAAMAGMVTFGVVAFIRIYRTTTGRRSGDTENHAADQAEG
jgi:hypothetical protein